MITHFDVNLTFLRQKEPLVQWFFQSSTETGSQGTEVRPLSSRVINIFQHFMCGVRSRDINSSQSNTKQSLITSVMEAFSNIAREVVKRGYSQFKLRLGEALGAQNDLTRETERIYPNKQYGAVSSCCYSYLSCYHHFYFHLKMGVNTSRTL